MPVYQNSQGGRSVISPVGSPVVVNQLDDATVLPGNALSPETFLIVLDTATVASSELAPGKLTVAAPQSLERATVVMAYFDGFQKHQYNGWQVSADRKSFEIWFPTDPAERAVWLGSGARWEFLWFPMF
jgi:hypothetical protein